jgi:hypothetical protein
VTACAFAAVALNKMTEQKIANFMIVTPVVLPDYTPGYAAGH